MEVVSTKHGTSVEFGIPTVGSKDSDKTGLDNKNWSGSKLSPSPVLTPQASGLRSQASCSRFKVQCATLIMDLAKVRAHHAIPTFLLLHLHTINDSTKYLRA